jgi:predicted enzyme related to lactoylglutathione lyase
MVWSKLKERFESQVATPLRGRLRVHVTRYTKSAMDVGRGWITLDGREIVSVQIPSFYSFNFQFRTETLDFGKAIYEYLSLPIEEALASSDELIAGFALLDRRVGKRTLAKIKADQLHAFARILYDVRRAAEGRLALPEQRLGVPMSGPAKAGLFLYAKDLARLAGFYESVLGMTRIRASDELVVLQSPDIQLVVHAIPPHIAQTITIASPPQRRTNTALKFFFTVASLGAAEEAARSLGGEVDSEEWQGPGFRVRNAYDPEGNVFQVRESIP